MGMLKILKRITAIGVVLLVIFVAVYLYFIRDWKRKTNIDEALISDIAYYIND